VRRTPEKLPRGPGAPAVSLLSDDDLYLFNEGSHLRLWEHLGAHRAVTPDGTSGVYFAVWAPDAASVSVIGDFNGWDRTVNAMHPRATSGIWEGFVAGVQGGALYKFFITSRHRGYRVEKADPFAASAEIPPKTASVVWDLEYDWQDGEWMETRARRNSREAPMSIYELHIGSWRRRADDGWRSLSYRELAVELADHVVDMGFTHVELMPVMEHPFFGSWGYQVTSYFAPSARYGTPQDLMYLIDTLHQRGVGVILDWVPSHFPTDEHGLAFFDGHHLFEHADPRQGLHPDWNSAIFNYGRNEVRSFLLSSAMFWLDVYHADGLRVDAVASMLYLDYSRKEGEWVPNKFGGRENIDAVAFLRRLNEEAYRHYPGTQTLAEESTAWPMVSRPTSSGGLGFGFKWDMGWMHDTLDYMQRDPVHRRFHQNQLTFRSLYAFTENYVLPLSHDEVVHGKGSIYARMAGDEWQKLANLRLLLGYMYATPGKKLMFMGTEFGQRGEWNHDGQLEWPLLDDPRHDGVRRWMRDLNRIYGREPALHQLDCEPTGFSWIDGSDAANSVLAFSRHDAGGGSVVAVLNFTPVPRHSYRIGVSEAGDWVELLNSDATAYGGSGHGNGDRIESTHVAAHGRRHSLDLTLPPLAMLILAPKGIEHDGSA
jgi:1,4-alpha-glucan branching enzyme